MLGVGWGEWGALSDGLICICLSFQNSQWADKLLSSVLGILKRVGHNIDPEKISHSNFADKTCTHQHTLMNDQLLKPTEMFQASLFCNNMYVRESLVSR